MQTGRNTLHIACSQGCNDVIRVLLESGKINDINDKTNVFLCPFSYVQDNRDVLSLAVTGNCSLHAIAMLMAHGAATNVTDEVELEEVIDPSINAVYFIKQY